MVIEQGEHELKHITLMRKVIMDRRSGVATFEGSDWSVTIPFDHGVLLLEENVSGALSRVLQGPVLRFSWNDAMYQTDCIAVPIMTREAFSQALAVLDLPEDRLEFYRKKFSGLPPVKVRLTSVFHFDLAYQALFQELYQMALAVGGAHLGEYFDASAAGELRRKRVNVVLALYCMGDLLSVPSHVEAGAIPHGAAVSTAAAEKANVVSRILMRLRGA